MVTPLLLIWLGTLTNHWLTLMIYLLLLDVYFERKWFIKIRELFLLMKTHWPKFVTFWAIDLILAIEHRSICLWQLEGYLLFKENLNAKFVWLPTCPSCSITCHHISWNLEAFECDLLWISYFLELNKLLPKLNTTCIDRKVKIQEVFS